MAQNRVSKGPSKFTLSVAFFDKINGERRPVTFTVYGPDFPQGVSNIEVVINSLQWEDGSGESWNFVGYISEGPTDLKSKRIKGYFQTVTREGLIEIDTPIRPTSDFVKLVEDLKKQRGG